MERYSTEFYEPIVHDYANFGTWTDSVARDTITRATQVRKGILAKDERPSIEGDRVEALQSFIAKRTAEGGAAPES